VAPRVDRNASGAAANRSPLPAVLPRCRTRVSTERLLDASAVPETVVPSTFTQTPLPVAPPVRCIDAWAWTSTQDPAGAVKVIDGPGESVVHVPAKSAWTPAASAKEVRPVSVPGGPAAPGCPGVPGSPFAPASPFGPAGPVAPVGPATGADGRASRTTRSSLRHFEATRSARPASSRTCAPTTSRTGRRRRSSPRRR
jgi:hypothetical protein